RCPTLAIGQLDPHQQLGSSNGSDRHVLVVADQVEWGGRPALRSNEHGGIEDQACQGSVSLPTDSRSSRSSSAHAASGRFRLRTSFKSRPVAPTAGPTVATARPRRITTKLSRPFSTESSISEKRRAASVAVTCLIKSDYQR